jgi:hypothetical protein
MLTLWDAEGDFVDVGSEATSTHNFSELRIRLEQGSTYYVVAGSEFDRLQGYINTDDRGEYQIEITRPESGSNVSLNYFAVARDAGGEPQVTVYDAQSGSVVFDFLAYAPQFTGGVRVALGDVSGDGVPDIITAAGPGGGPHVRVFNGVNGSELMGFYAYWPGFSGGVFVAAGDVNGDGQADIITAAGAGGGPHVRVFSGVDGSELMGFFAYDTSFTGGVSVAAGDVDGDGRADVVTGAGPGGGPHVRVISGLDQSEVLGFFAYHPSFAGGVYVAAGDVNGDGQADVITGAGAGGGPHVRVISGQDHSELRGFFAYHPGFGGGVRVATGDLDGDGLADILTAAGHGGGPHVRGLGGMSGADLAGFFAYEAGFSGGLFVAGAAWNAQGVAASAAASAASTDALSVQQLELIRSAALLRWQEAGPEPVEIELPFSTRRLPSTDLVDDLFSQW